MRRLGKKFHHENTNKKEPKKKKHGKEQLWFVSSFVFFLILV